MREKIVSNNTDKVLPQNEKVTIVLNRNDANSLIKCLITIREYQQSHRDGGTLHFVIKGAGDEIPGHTPVYNISQEEIERIGAELENCNQLRGLTLVGWAGPTFNEDELMLNFFQNLPNLNKVEFVFCEIHEQLGQMQDILKSSQLCDLSFIDCNELLSYEFMDSLGEGMEDNTTLKRLSLFNNDLALFSGGLQRFLDLSKANTHPTLEELDLHGNDWTTTVELTNGYQFHPELLNNYEYNQLVNFMQQTTQSIVDLLESNHHLQRLRLGFHKDSPYITGKSFCPDEQIEKIATALSNNTTLTYFSMSHLSFKSMQRIAAALKNNFTLTHFEATKSDYSPEWFSKEIMPLLMRNRLIKEGAAFLYSIREAIDNNQPIDSLTLEQAFAFSLELMEYKKLGLVNNTYLTTKCEEVSNYFRNQLLDKLFPYTIKLFAKQLIYPETYMLPVRTTRDTGIELFIDHLLPINLSLPVTIKENKEIIRDKLQLVLLLIRHYQGPSSDVPRIRNNCLIAYQGRNFQPFESIETILGCDRVLTIAQFLSLLENEYNIREEKENYNRLMNTIPEDSLIENTENAYDLIGMWLERSANTDSPITQAKPEIKMEKIVIYEQALLDGSPNRINVPFPLSALSQKELIDLIEIHRGMNVHCTEQEKALLRWLTEIIDDIQTISILKQEKIIKCSELIRAFPTLKADALLEFIIANFRGIGKQSVEEEKAFLKLIEIIRRNTPEIDNKRIEANLNSDAARIDIEPEVDMDIETETQSTNPQQQPSITDLGMFKNVSGNNPNSVSNNNLNWGEPPTSPRQ